MADRNAKAPRAPKAQSAQGARQTTKPTFSDDERAAMKERAAEVKRQRASASRADGEKDVQDKIAAMPDDDRELATKVHEIVQSVAPDLVPRTWYGMPAYARDGDVILFFQNAAKFKARYSTIGFSDKANLDKGSIWPTYFAITRMTSTAERELRALIRQAIA